MKTFTERLLFALEQQLLEIKSNAEPEIEQHRAAILVCRKAMAKLKNYIASYAFASLDEEVDFFKNTKPQFYSRYIYHVNVHNYLMQKPAGSGDIRLAYILMHLDEIKTFFDHNRAFYAYYRSGITQLDELYYTRSGFAIHPELEDFEEDEQYSTSHDYKLSKIIANEHFQTYLNNQLNPQEPATNYNTVQWTATQTDAIELIYALKASGSINNGNIEIATLVTLFEQTFNMTLKDHYHKYTDITNRKKELALYLIKLKDSLYRYINDKLGL